ncbi:hypothetical protein [Lyngbya sp. PCC 8106]|uniref:hypothetical protein n=1 Tax=Lyngbya sp. (strain PCC 8106) TaxID=313612 RepID=UPI0000EACBB5|nr:hypothetical protein [Lyngbya sp. PCC 8106]EAW34044.1 hypothetical protein L8106_26492 [Lyngbya sp. PCC 8106]
MTRSGSFPSGVLGALTDSRLFEQKEFRLMKTSSLDIDSTTKQHHPTLSSVGRTQTQYGEKFYRLHSPKLNSNSTSNSELILTQVRLDAIESERVMACYRYIQLCQELDEITLQNEQYFGFHLQLEQDKIYQEILIIIVQICQIELERVKTQSLKY